jgi:hypothetical protein
MNKYQPIRTTLILTLIYCLFFFPLKYGMVLVFPFLPDQGNNLIIWLFLSIYCLFLAKWGEKKRTSILFPLSILLIIALTPGNYLFLSLALLSFAWIRSSICFPEKPHLKIGGELLLTLGGAIMIAVFSPLNDISMVMAIWLYGLVQALYFVLFPLSSEKHFSTIDPFERARKEAERMLAHEEL